jgi:hypothetical protein
MCVSVRYTTGSELTAAGSFSTYELEYEVNVFYSTATFGLDEEENNLFFFKFIYGLFNLAVA